MFLYLIYQFDSQRRIGYLKHIFPLLLIPSTVMSSNERTEGATDPAISPPNQVLSATSPVSPERTAQQDKRIVSFKIFPLRAFLDPA